jgi:hypothetical protein
MVLKNPLNQQHEETNSAVKIYENGIKELPLSSSTTEKKYVHENIEWLK